jgi:DNA-directed RNA polymerase specialized sigma24 family protein
MEAVSSHAFPAPDFSGAFFLNDTRSSEARRLLVPEELCRRWELAKRAIRLSHGFSPKLRETFELPDLQRLSVSEAAELLGIRDSTAKANTRGHLRLLKGCWKTPDRIVDTGVT